MRKGFDCQEVEFHTIHPLAKDGPSTFRCEADKQTGRLVNRFVTSWPKLITACNC